MRAQILALDSMLSLPSRLLLAAAVLMAGAQARTFHVDAARGDDAQDGLKPETAWRSLAAANRASLAPGDRVLFRRGQTWRGQLIPQNGDAGGVVTYGAFGDGPKPILLGSVAAARPTDWQRVAEGIWETSPLRFQPVGVQTDLQHERWSLHQEGGASCTLTPEEHEGAVVLRLTCRNPGTRANHLQLSAPQITVREGEYYLFAFRAQATRSVTPAAVSVMKSSPPWTAYATTETALPAFGTNWVEHNTCVDSGSGWGHGQRPDPNGRHLMFYDNSAATTDVVIRGNIFCTATDSLLRLHGRDWTGALVMDRNCWFQPRGPVLIGGAKCVHSGLG